MFHSACHNPDKCYLTQMNRCVFTICAGLLTLPVFVFVAALSQAALTPVDLRVNGGSHHTTGSGQTRFSWRVESAEQNKKQLSWQILVASGRDLLEKNQGDFWDSGKQPTSRSPMISYGGKPFSSDKTYYWKVRCWDEKNEDGSWSEPAVLEVVPATTADWRGAKWIDDGRENPREDKDFYQPDPAPLFRKEFSIEKPIARARLHVAGLGYILTSFNGNRLADAPLDPPWTAFDKRILFRTHDVTQILKQGNNCIGLALGNGWYNPLPLRMWSHRNIRGSMTVGRPRAIALLVIDHSDGSHTTVTSGSDWQVAQGPTMRNSVYLGEERDARLLIHGWDSPDFDASSWKKARLVDAPMQTLQPLLDMPPVRETEKIAAASITTHPSGIHLVDFGINFTGIPVIELDAPAGTKITLRFGEILHPDGSLNPMTSVCGQIKGMRKSEKGHTAPIGGSGAPEIAWQQDIYVSREGKQTYRPDFTFHAFRYMEISGLEKTPAKENIHALRLHSDLPATGSFSCSNDLLNRIQQVTRNTFINNVISVQSDCPHRERFGYGGDIAVTSEAYMMNYDMSGFYAKTIRDWADSARPDGNFTDTAPFVGVQYCGIGWAMVHPLLLEQHYQHYGNVALILEQLPAAMRWFELEASKRKNGLVPTGLGDHEAFKRLGGPPVTTPMFIDTALRMARLCLIVGDEANSQKYLAMVPESFDAWNKSYHDALTGSVGGNTQSELALALGFGAVGGKEREAVLEQLITQVESQPDGPSLTTGIFGTRFLLELFSQNGRHDLSYQLATRKAFPSWGHMLENGATSLWETWKQSDNTFSHNHPMFGSISAWFFRHLGGIQIADDAVGADRLLICPKPAGDLKWVKCSHRTVRGTVVSNWKQGDKESEYEIMIPPDTSATIELPRREGDVITDTVTGEIQQGERWKVKSGRYRFVIRHST